MGKRSLRQKRSAEIRGRNRTRRPLRRMVIAGGSMVFMIAILLYTPALKNSFVNWDDGIYVYENSHIRSLSPGAIHWMLTSFHATNWHPLTWLSHAVDYALSGYAPGGHHLTSILLHGLNTLLVMLLTLQLSLTAHLPAHVSNSSVQTFPIPFKSLVTGCVTALLFGIHPLHAESVAWVAERKNVLCTFFFLLALLWYCFFVSAAGKRKRVARFTACLILAAAALMAKPMAVTLPLILLLLDIYPFKRINLSAGANQNRQVLLEKVPFLLLSVISAILTVLAQHAGGAFESLERLPLSMRLVNALHSPVFYVAKMLWPGELVPFYPFPKVIGFLDLAYYSISGILVLSVTAGCIWLWKRGRYLFLTAWVYYLVTLLPVLGVIQVGSQAAADRYTYLPGVGIFLLAGSGVSQLVAKFAGRKNILAAGAVVVSLICIALGQLTVKQIAIWQDSETLWTSVIKQFPGRVPIAHNNLGVLYDGRGLHDKALEEYERAVAINPTFADAHSNLGVSYKRKGNHEKAIEEYEKALAGNPNLIEARNNLGVAYQAKGMYDKAVQEYEKVLAINPNFAETHYNLGLVYYFQGMVDKAVDEYEKAIAVNPALAVAHYKLGLTYYETKDFARAKIHIDRAQNLGYEVDAKIAELIKQAP